jgi:predicted enzyme related to lactoylglutathione lyase
MADASKAPSFGAVAFVYLAKSVDDVPRILAKAEAAGGQIVKPATRTPWGVAGYFKDPDGHLFEVDYEDCWVFDTAGRLVVDELNTKNTT